MRDSNREVLEEKLQRPFLPPENFGHIRTWMDLDGIAGAAAVLMAAIIVLFCVSQSKSGGVVGDPKVTAKSITLGDSTQDLLAGLGDAGGSTINASDSGGAPAPKVEQVEKENLKVVEAPPDSAPVVVDTQDNNSAGVSAVQDAVEARRQQKAKAAKADAEAARQLAAANAAGGQGPRPGGQGTGVPLGGAQIAGVFRVDPDVKSVVYVIDHSGSMSLDRRLERVKAELVFAVRALEESQKFSVVFFDDTYWALGDLSASNDQDPDRKLKLFEATEANKKMAIDWIVQQVPVGGTNPTPACFLALTAKPELVMLLSDGDFPPFLVNEITKRNHSRSRTPARIDCVGVAEQIQTLQDIAKQNKGTYFPAR